VPIELPWQAIKEWIPDDEPDLTWFNQPRKLSEPDPDWFDQPQHGRKPPKSRSIMATSSTWNTPDREGVPHKNRCKNFSTKFLGKAERMAIFSFEEFPHESGRKPLFLAQIRRLEP